MDLAANDDLRDLLLSYTDDPLAMTSSQGIIHVEIYLRFKVDSVFWGFLYY